MQLVLQLIMWSVVLQVYRSGFDNGVDCSVNGAVVASGAAVFVSIIPNNASHGSDNASSAIVGNSSTMPSNSTRNINQHLMQTRSKSSIVKKKAVSSAVLGIIVADFPVFADMLRCDAIVSDLVLYLARFC
ncbi:hypothetical protein U1Q18_002154 [Sarracenia purpurea var. burkii]